MPTTRTRKRMGVVIVLLVGGVLSAAMTVGVRKVVRDQEHRLLKERSSEAGLLLSNIYQQQGSGLSSLGIVARLTNASPVAFAGASAPLVKAGGGSVALAQQSGDGFVVVGSAGPAFTVGQPMPAETVPTLQHALTTSGLVASDVYQRGASRLLGLAVGAPAPAGMVVYSESTVAGTKVNLNSGAFSELDGAFYASPTADPHTALLTTAALPLKGTIDSQHITVGTKQWLLEVRARQPLVGSLAMATPWILLLVGILATLAVMSILELVGRRRDYALTLVDERTEELRHSLEALESAQEQLVRQERLAAIGQLASAVGHELRNPLAVISNALYLLRDGIGPDASERVTRQLNTADREVSAATLIVSDLLEFARARQPILSPVDLGNLLDEALSVAPPPTGISVDQRRPVDLPAVTADRDQLRQVLLNLLTNAYEAMPEGGVITIAGEVVAGAVRVSVVDTGLGMDADTRTHVFEPFFTTKARGVGLGLAVAKRIVEDHSGTMEVESTPGHGTTFAITLPAAESSVLVGS